MRTNQEVETIKDRAYKKLDSSDNFADQEFYRMIADLMEWFQGSESDYINDMMSDEV